MPETEQNGSEAMPLPEVSPPEIQLQRSEKFDEHEIKVEIEEINNSGENQEIINNMNPISNPPDTRSSPSASLKLKLRVEARVAEMNGKLKELGDSYELTLENLRDFNLPDYEDILRHKKKLLLRTLAALVNKELKEFGDLYDELQPEEFKKSGLKACADDISNTLEVFFDLYDELTEETNKMKKRSFKVINIDGENEAIDGNPDINKHKKQDHTVWASFLALKFGIAISFGNPFDKLPKLLESTGKVKQQSVINSGEALRVFAQPITWNAILFGSFIFSTIHAPLGFRVSANSIQMLLLVYCILAEAEALSDCAVMWGSTQIPALLFVCGWASVLVLLIAFIIAGLKYSRFSPK